MFDDWLQEKLCDPVFRRAYRRLWLKHQLWRLWYKAKRLGENIDRHAPDR